MEDDMVTPAKGPRQKPRKKSFISVFHHKNYNINYHSAINYLSRKRWIPSPKWLLR